MRNQVYQAVVNEITQVQRASGWGGNISGSTRPMRDIGHFSSLNAVEVSMGVSAALGVELKDDVALFFDKDNRQARTVDQIVDSICAEINDSQESA